MHGHIRIDVVAGHDAAGLRALLAQQARQPAGVDAGDGHDAAALEILRQRQVRSPVAGQQRQVADHQTSRRHHGGLLVFRRGAGIADVWIGQRDDLSGVGRIGKNFLITRHRGIEDDFAGGISFCSDGRFRGIRFHPPEPVRRSHSLSDLRCCSRLVIGLAIPVFEVRMHKAGGVLVERPPALRGLNPKLDVSDSAEILRSGTRSCPCEIAPRRCNAGACIPLR